MDAIGLSNEALVDLRQNSPDAASFTTELKVRGVNSKPLQEKLASLI